MKVSKWRMAELVCLVTALVFLPGREALAATECCDEPGAVELCWWQDADQDGATCTEDSDCATGQSCDMSGAGTQEWPAGRGLCTCTSHDQCGSGVCVASAGRCGPSYCNGFKVCTCSGGCQDVDMVPGDDSIDTPFELCASSGSVPNCCDYAYPGTPGAEALQMGHCTDSTACVNCRNDSECVDNNPCTINEGCDPSTLQCDTGDLVVCDDGNYCNGLEYCNPNDNDGNPCTAGPPLVCDDLNDCTDDICDVASGCVYTPNDSAPECCLPGDLPTYEDTLYCTADSCPEPPTASGPFDPFYDYHDYNVPDYTIDPGLCCTNTFLHCGDNNVCTVDTCCNMTNAADPACAANGVDWECKYEADLALAGCCETAADCDPIPCQEAVCVTGTGDPARDNHCEYQNQTANPPDPGCCDEDSDCPSAGACMSGVCALGSGRCYSEPNGALGCCGPTTTCAASPVPCMEAVCCDDWAVINGIPAECAAADPWSCVDVPDLGNPNCCAVDADCVSTNPCQEATCNLGTNQCELNPFAVPPAGCCNTPGTGTDPLCDDAANDPNSCTENVCTDDYYCSNPALPPASAPQGCCTDATVDVDCNPQANGCLSVSCDAYNNCQVAVQTAAVECCSIDDNSADGCPAAGGSRPCLADSSCNLTGDEYANANYGHCDFIARPEGYVCNPGEDCYDKICDDEVTEAASNYRCDTFDFVPMNPQTPCTVALADPCLDYFCDGAGGCTQTVSKASSAGNQECATSLFMTLPINFQEDSSCASELYTVSSTGFGDRFDGSCSGADKAELVYNYDDSTGDEYELNHTIIEVVPDPAVQPAVAWDPIIYTEIDCGDNTTQYTCNDDCGFGGTNYNATDYGVGAGVLLGECDPALMGETALSVGPWGVEDVPDYNEDPGGGDDFDQNSIHDGYYREPDTNVTVMVDAQDTAENGGDFEFTADQEPHNNNDCYNTASYVAAPIIDGDFDWKQRWRGDISSDYKNIFWALDPTERLGYLGVPNADNPKPAMFKFELNAGAGRYLAYVDPWALYHRRESGYPDTILDAETRAAGEGNDARFFPTALSRLEMDGDTCGLAIAPEISSTGTFPYLSRLIIDADTAEQEGYLAVVPQSGVAAPSGTYELSVVKEQPVFFGLMDAYQERSGCGRVSDFDGEGKRVDWIPNGSSENGYMVVVNDLGTNPPDTCSHGDIDGWLVHPTCYQASPGVVDWTDFGGYTGNNFADWIDLPFRFPIGDQFANMLYLDSAGRILPREGVGVCNIDGDCNDLLYPDHRYCACDARISGGTCGGSGRCVRGDPRGIDTDPDIEKFFQPSSEGGYAPVIAAAWGDLQPRWDDPGDGRGYVTGQTVVFEGTTAYAITWVGYDAKDDLYRYYYDTYEEHLNFQVILRADGRIAFYYRHVPSRNPWSEMLQGNSFMMGVSGGLSTIDCVDGDPGHTQCSNAYGAEAECDNESYSEGGHNYTPTNTCMRIFSGVLGSAGLGNE